MFHLTYSLEILTRIGEAIQEYGTFTANQMRPTKSRSFLSARCSKNGSWLRMQVKNPIEKKFIPYKALTYITFYKDQEHDDRNFETWSGAYA